MGHGENPLYKLRVNISSGEAEEEVLPEDLDFVEPVPAGDVIMVESRKIHPADRSVTNFPHML